MRDTVMVVTGGTGALGSAVARAAIEAGALVTVTYRDPREADALVALVPATMRDRLHAVQADVTAADGVRRLVETVVARHQRAVGAVCEHAGDVAGRRGDHRQAGRERFEDGHRLVVNHGGIDEDVGAGHQRRHVGR